MSTLLLGVAKVREYAKKYVLVLLVAVVVASSGVAVYFYNEYKDLKANPNKTTQDEVSKFVGLVSKLMILPDGETPTIATVADLEKLKDQPFFGKAKVGDKVLIYTNAKRAILYSPESNKIIEVAPINIGATPTPASAPVPPKFQAPVR